MQASRVSAKPGDRQYEGVQSPSMIIQKFSPQEIQVNQTADFEIKIRNVGRVAVDDVLVVDRVPDGARFIDANPKPTSQSRTGELQWQLGTMNPGQERTVLLQLEPTEPGRDRQRRSVLFWKPRHQSNQSHAAKIENHAHRRSESSDRKQCGF